VVTLNSFLRILYIFFGPGFALVFGSLLFCTLAIKLMPDDPVQEQISTSLNNYIDANPNNIVWVFNDNVFITTKPIKQGQAYRCLSGGLRRARRCFMIVASRSGGTDAPVWA
jgi:hypothetical protein